MPPPIGGCSNRAIVSTDIHLSPLVGLLMQDCTRLKYSLVLTLKHGSTHGSTKVTSQLQVSPLRSTGAGGMDPLPLVRGEPATSPSLAFGCLTTPECESPFVHHSPRRSRGPHSNMWLWLLLFIATILLLLSLFCWARGDMFLAFVLAVTTILTARQAGKFQKV